MGTCQLSKTVHLESSRAEVLTGVLTVMGPSFYLRYRSPLDLGHLYSHVLFTAKENLLFDHFNLHNHHEKKCEVGRTVFFLLIKLSLKLMSHSLISKMKVINRKSFQRFLMIQLSASIQSPLVYISSSLLIWSAMCTWWRAGSTHKCGAMASNNTNCVYDVHSLGSYFVVCVVVGMMKNT